LPEYVQAASLVLTMTQSHKRAVTSMMPEAAGKVFTLTEYGDEPGEVPDPFGGSCAVYEECARALERLLDKVWQKIVILAGKTD
jgi:protein-tyrosine-phosphatase